MESITSLLVSLSGVLLAVMTIALPILGVIGLFNNVL